MRLKNLAPLVMLFIVIGASLGLAAEVLSDVQLEGEAPMSNAINNTTAGLGRLASWLPVMGMVGIGAIVVSTMFYLFKGIR